MALGHGHQHRQHRRAHLRARFRHRRHRPACAIVDRQGEPTSGQGYIIASSVVVWRRRQSLGNARRAMSLGYSHKSASRSTARCSPRSRTLVLLIPVHPERPRGPFASKGRAVEAMTRRLDNGHLCYRICLRRRPRGRANIAAPPTSPVQVPTMLMALWANRLLRRCWAL